MTSDEDIIKMREGYKDRMCFGPFSFYLNRKLKYKRACYACFSSGSSISEGESVEEMIAIFDEVEKDSTIGLIQEAVFNSKQFGEAILTKTIEERNKIGVRYNMSCPWHVLYPAMLAVRFPVEHERVMPETDDLLILREKGVDVLFTYLIYILLCPHIGDNNMNKIGVRFGRHGSWASGTDTSIKKFWNNEIYVPETIRFPSDGGYEPIHALDSFKEHFVYNMTPKFNIEHSFQPILDEMQGMTLRECVLHLWNNPDKWW